MIRAHLLPEIQPRSVGKACEPLPEHLQTYKDVCAILRKRLQDAKRKVDNQIKASKNTTDISSVFNTRPSVADVNEQWIRAFVRKGLPLDLFDCEEFRAAVLITARAGTTYVEAGKPKLPHRTYMGTKALTALDEKLELKISGCMAGLITEIGAMVISDGWTSIQDRPIINALLATPVGTKFLKAIDTSGETKDKEFIADFVIDVINESTPKNIVAVCMDGACMSSFAQITEAFPWVFCFICPTHSLDNFLKNVCGNQDKIRMTGIEGEFEWGSSVFSTPLEEAKQVINFIRRHGKPLSIFRDICTNPQTWEYAKLKPDFVELIKFCDTRFASNLIMLQRYHALRIVVESFVANIEYNAWLKSQSKVKQEQALHVKQIVQAERHWEEVSVTVAVLEPIIKVLRLTDGKSGATLGKVFGWCANIAAEFKKDIPGVTKEDANRIHTLFQARWTYFHTNVFTAAMFLDSEFITDKHTRDEKTEFRAVLELIAVTPDCEYTLDDMTSDWSSLQTALLTKTSGMNNKSAFTDRACKMAPFEWAREYLFQWPAIQWVAMRLGGLSCSASGCEHSWSLEGWMHSGKRNRLGQNKVQRLVRAHSNLLLESKLEGWRPTSLPWEIDMQIHMGEDDDESEETED